MKPKHLILTTTFMALAAQTTLSAQTPQCDEFRKIEASVGKKFNQISAAVKNIPGWTGYAAGLAIGLPLAFDAWRRRYKKGLSA